MTKHNKKRYTRHEKPKPVIHFSGQVWLEYRDEDQIALPAKGDMKLYPSVDALHTIARGEYWSTGYAGYFRVDINDGRQWCPVSLPELFPDREHHFRKSECPIDTFTLCEELLKAKTGAAFKRTYREHYMLEEGSEPLDSEQDSSS